MTWWWTKNYLIYKLTKLSVGITLYDGVAIGNDSKSNNDALLSLII